MPPANGLQPKFMYIREVNDVQHTRDVVRDLLPAWGKRQDSLSPLPADSLAQDTPTPSLDSPSVASTTATQLTSSPPNLTPSYVSTSSTPPLASISQSLSHPSTESARPSPSSEHTKAIIFGIIGGILALLILGYVAFRLLRRYQQKSQKRLVYESFWEKWHWGTYSPVDGDVIYANHDLETTTRSKDKTGGGDQSVISRTWWQNLGFRPLPEVSDDEEGKKKKSRTRTMYKVRSFKPGQGFDIDSCASSGVVDLK